MRYRPFLSALHELLQPQRYVEIGVRYGDSLALSRCKSVGIDPAYQISSELNCDVSLFRTTSDEYFARPDPLAPTGGQPFDLAFIDGLHLFEFALRDFINVERHSTPRSVIVFDDVLPRSIDEAARLRHTVEWTGDVYPVIAVLEKYRPDLTVIPVGTQPTGLLLAMGLDPTNTALTDNYDAIVAEFRAPDPQPVPEWLLDRLNSAPPERVLASDVWRVLTTAPPDLPAAELRARIGAAVSASLGAAFAPRNPVDA